MYGGGNSSAPIDKGVTGKRIHRHNGRISQKPSEFYRLSHSFSDNRNNTNRRGLLIHHSNSHLIRNDA